MINFRFWAVFTAAISASAASAGPLEYNRDVRPILAENCFACHGPDSAARKASLRLDRRDDAIEAKAIVPGDAKDSGLVERIEATDPSEIMPPPKSHKTLTAAQKATLKQWITEGAAYQPHWSFIAPIRPTAPTVKNKAWVRNPIDAFILATLEKHGLKPAPEADRRTLARRLSLDLIGLPPEPADVETFVNDKSKDYYEKYVDKLMASPHYGEHQARYWLDGARYGDTHGILIDNYREIWAYRDWVIKALNDNKRFDDFTLEQLAGDLLPNRTLDQQVATGFNRCNITTSEGGAINEEYLVLYTRDRTETASQVFLGLTTGCAVCHDHKFDPISTREFYSLSAFFNNTTQAAMDGNVSNTPPVVTVPRAADRARWDTITKELADIRTKADARKVAARGDFKTWLKTASAEQVGTELPTEGLNFHAPLTEAKGRTVKINVAGDDHDISLVSGFDWTIDRDGQKSFTLRNGRLVELPTVGDFERNDSFTASGWVLVPRRNQTGAIMSRMDTDNAYRGWDVWLQADKVGMHIVNAWGTDALKVVSKTPLAPGKWHHFAITYDGSSKAAGVNITIDGEPQAVDVEADNLKSSIRTKEKFRIASRSKDSRLAAGIGLYDLRVYSRRLNAGEVRKLARSSRVSELLAKPTAKRTDKETELIYAWWLGEHDAESKELTAKMSSLTTEEAAIRSRGTITHVSQEKPGDPLAYILFRGEYDKRRDQVKAATPKALPPMADDLPRNRLGFAKWLLTKDHPLTARVTVNRFWQEIFGTGIVKTSGDFGITGELPSHPELLDWLACEFREPTWDLGCCEYTPGWDMKRFIKMIVTSAAYRQAAVTTKDKLERDRDNRLLSRGPRYRMDAEMIRDYALSASGLLVNTIGGPSVRPYQPDGVWEAVAMPGSDTRNYRRDTGEKLYRRSMYTFWKRAAPPASMEVLNAPNRETCTVRRERTNTPIQALLTLNDVQYVEAARVLAEKTLNSADSDDDRIDFLALRLLARPFRDEEMAVVRSSLIALRSHYKSDEAAAKKLIEFGESKADPKLEAMELAAWTMLANELLNLDEVLNK